MEQFTPVSALAGGLLIGAASALLLWLNGRLAGISGIVGGLFAPGPDDIVWRILFALGLVAGVLAYRTAGGPLQSIEITGSLPLLIAGGLAVGIGTRLGGGCTSGHGICGIARLSPRSITATITFIITAAITVFAMRHGIGG